MDFDNIYKNVTKDYEQLIGNKLEEMIKIYTNIESDDFILLRSKMDKEGYSIHEEIDCERPVSESKRYVFKKYNKEIACFYEETKSINREDFSFEVKVSDIIEL